MYESFPVDSVGPRERLDYFQSVVDRVFCPMHVQQNAVSMASFRASIEIAHLGSIKLAKVTGSAAKVQRNAGHVSRLADAPYLVKFQVSGESRWTQRRREAHLRPGDFVICSMAEPYTLEFRGAYEMPVLALSVATMRKLTPDPDRFLGTKMLREDADCGLLSSFVAQVVARMSRLGEPMIRRVEANILDLLGGVLSARADRRTLSPAVELCQIKAYIDNHLHDGRLRPATIAAAFAMSPRRLHSLFEAESLSVGTHIRNQRVNACRRLLLEEGPARGRSLTDIALSCGFYDLSHMSRCFRDRFGLSPREFRSQRGARPR